MTDLCICCGSQLAKMERNRSICWECIDKSNESYEEANESDYKKNIKVNDIEF